LGSAIYILVFLNGLTIKKELQDMLWFRRQMNVMFRLVQNVAGKAIKIKYQQGAYFQSDIHRHVYFNGNATIGLADFSFEIDDAGNY
jgi:hypothetical protein